VFRLALGRPLNPPKVQAHAPRAMLASFLSNLILGLGTMGQICPTCGLRETHRSARKVPGFVISPLNVRQCETSKGPYCGAAERCASS
jgi:hypothetical protein